MLPYFYVIKELVFTCETIHIHTHILDTVLPLPPAVKSPWKGGLQLGKTKEANPKRPPLH
ncbi:DUF6396 domain-containing protein [Echinicola strongylocentroti]|uniref:DUF6396 domain-containing protein n=1 Tax=Echinicola strongylocentroti TaxID=1795355 RepID=UPI0037448884